MKTGQAPRAMSYRALAWMGMLMAGALVTLSPATRADAPLFEAKTDFATGTGPGSLAIGDLDGDGLLDLAVTNFNSATVSVLLGNGDGTFGAHTEYTTGIRPGSVAIGDLNGDGTPDLTMLTGLYGSATVLPGIGGGTFGTSTDFPNGNDSRSMAMGDLNQDGRLDLALPNPSQGTVSVLLGNGDGTFGTSTDFPAGSAPYKVAIGDLNGDGRPDLAVTNQFPNTIAVLLGNGDGTFGASTGFATAIEPAGVAIGDLNGDGKPDLAVASHYLSTIAVMLGHGDGTFGSYQQFPTGNAPLSVAIADLNGDGRPDLVAANNGYFSDGSTVSVLLGVGNGMFVSKVDFGTGIGPQSAAIGDLNGDGQPDLAVANYGANTVSVLLHSDVSTPVVITRLEAMAIDEGVTVTWAMAIRGAFAIDLERAESEAGPWLKIDAERHDQGEVAVVVDHSAVPGRRYWFRLVATDAAGTRAVFGPVNAVAGSPKALSLTGVWPNPTQGAMRCEFAVPRQMVVSIVVVDVQGRTQQVLARDSFAPGRYQVSWDGVTDRGTRAAAGMYFVRLEAGTQKMARKFFLAQ